MRSEAKRAIELLQKAGFSAYLVGGSVRDFLMGRQPEDIDIAASALPDQVVSVFKEFKTIETGIRYGTVTVSINSMPLEITTFRTESTYSDHRRPDSVTFTSDICQDLSRRDFTINAMAYCPDCVLVDPFGGRQDLQSRLIRCVGTPKDRFEEDALRILRALRFASVLDFSIEPETDCAIHESKHLLTNISRERIWAEWKKLIMGKGIRRILLDYCDVVGVIIPEIAELKGFPQNNPYHLYDVLGHTAVVTEAIKPELTLKLAAIFHDIGKPNCHFIDEKGQDKFNLHGQESAQITKNILSRLGSEKETEKRVLELVSNHDIYIKNDPVVIKKWLRKVGPDCLDQLIELKIADNKGQNMALFNGQQRLYNLQNMAVEIRKSGQCYSLKDLNISGKDLLNMGIAPGPQIGRLLNGVLDVVIEGLVENKKELLIKYVESGGEI